MQPKERIDNTSKDTIDLIEKIEKFEELSKLEQLSRDSVIPHPIPTQDTMRVTLPLSYRQITSL